MEAFNLDKPLISIDAHDGSSLWSIRDAVNGVQIFGGIGSGKTSGSGKMLALKYLKAGFGGLVLTAKTDEKALWVEYCKQAGRIEDLVVIEPGGKYNFNFIEYEASSDDLGSSPTANLVQVLKTVIRAGEIKGKGKSDDAFWENALDMLIANVIDLDRLAYGKVSIQEIYDIVQTAPTAETAITKEMVEKSPEAFFRAFNAARLNVQGLVKNWRNSVVDSAVSVSEQLILEHVPEARLFKMLDEFFLTSFRGLSDKTRSIIDYSFSGFLFKLLREPVYSLFCRNASNITPDESLQGKIILIALPVKSYHEVGRDCQIMFKYIWQRAMEKRDVSINPRPVFLWADEAQHFLHEYDAEYQATARSSRIATVYISQNLPNYFAAMGGESGSYKVKSFLGTLATKFFHANADVDTNTYSSDLVGSAFFENISDTTTIAETFSHSENSSLILERVIRPEEFVKLKTGSPNNNYVVQGVMHKQGDPFHNGMNHIKMSFYQHYNL